MKISRMDKIISILAVVLIVVVSVPAVSYASDSGTTKWDNAVYIDETFRSRLLDEECPFDDAVFGKKSFFCYEFYTRFIEQSENPLDCPYYDYFQNHDETNLFTESVYGYTRWSESSEDRYPFRLAYYCSDEMVMTFDGNRESCHLYSRSEIAYETSKWDDEYYLTKNVNEEPHGTGTYNYGVTPSSSVLSVNDSDYTYYSVSAGDQGGNHQQIYLYNAPFKIFDTVEHAVTYLYTGEETGLLYSPVPAASYDSGLYLENFKMTVHDSNVYSKYYLSFSYTIPDSVLNNYDINKLQLRIDNSCQWESIGYQNTSLIGQWSSNELNFVEDTQVDYIPLVDNRTGFVLYLDDISSVYHLIYDYAVFSSNTDTLKRNLLGVGKRFSCDGLSFSIGDVGFSHTDTMEVTKSRLSLNIFLEYNGSVMGHEYNGSVDFLDGDNSWLESYTPDSDGNYGYNGDYQGSDGYYYTDVGTDTAGNPTFNYYYYDSSGGRSQVDSSGLVIDNSTGNITQTVTVPDTINVNLNHGSSGNDVTIEDDDLSFSSLTEVLKSGFGLIDDIDTETKGDGYVSMLEDLFPFLPAAFSDLPVLGVGTVVAIAIIRAILKR